jgi:putative transposase
LPECLTVREVRFQVTTPGYRVKELVLATTLTDAAVYPAEDLADLYHERWHVELDIRALKISLQMDHLRCQTPFMVAKEIWAHFLGYNLVRKVSAQAALARGLHPREVSFKGTMDAVAAAWHPLTVAPTAAERQRQGQALLAILGSKPVGNRPDRCEPRQVKRRPKQYKHLRRPRAEARAKLLQSRG